MNDKKIFFVNPHYVIRDGVVDELIKKDYEVYLVDDFRDIKYICRTYRNPYIFINIDEDLDQYGWQVMISQILEDRELKHAKIGVITYNENRELAKNYLMDLMIPCGFVVLNQDLSTGTDQILSILEANEVNQRRLNVRTQCEKREASFNLNYKGTLYYGEINEISSVGMTVVFDEGVSITKNSLFNNIQIKLKSKLCLVPAVMIGHRVREDGKAVYVFIFNPSISEGSLTKIRQYINYRIQSDFTSQLSAERELYDYYQHVERAPLPRKMA